MEKYIGPDGRTKVRMTQSEFNAANGIKPPLVPNSPLRSNTPQPESQGFYPGRISRDGGKTWALPGEPVGFQENFLAGVNAQPNAQGVAGTLGNTARSLAVMAPVSLATSGLALPGYAAGMIGGGALDRVVTKKLESDYASAPVTPGEYAQAAREGGAMGLGSLLLGGLGRYGVGKLAGTMTKTVPTLSGATTTVTVNKAPALATQAAQALGEAVGWEGVSAPIEGRSFSPANVAGDVAFFGALKGLEAGVGSMAPSSKAEILADLYRQVPELSDTQMPKAETDQYINELYDTLNLSEIPDNPQLPAVDYTSNPEVMSSLAAALQKPAPYDYVMPPERRDASMGEVSLRPNYRLNNTPQITYSPRQKVGGVVDTPDVLTTPVQPGQVAPPRIQPTPEELALEKLVLEQPLVPSTEARAAQQAEVQSQKAANESLLPSGKIGRELPAEQTAPTQAVERIIPRLEEFMSRSEANKIVDDLALELGIPRKATQNAPESIIGSQPSQDIAKPEIASPEPVQSVDPEPIPAETAPVTGQPSQDEFQQKREENKNRKEQEFKGLHRRLLEATGADVGGEGADKANDVLDKLEGTLDSILDAVPEGLKKRAQGIVWKAKTRSANEDNFTLDGLNNSISAYRDSLADMKDALLSTGAVESAEPIRQIDGLLNFLPESIPPGRYIDAEKPKPNNEPVPFSKQPVPEPVTPAPAKKTYRRNKPVDSGYTPETQSIIDAYGSRESALEILKKQEAIARKNSEEINPSTERAIKELTQGPAPKQEDLFGAESIQSSPADARQTQLPTDIEVIAKPVKAEYAEIPGNDALTDLRKDIRRLGVKPGGKFTAEDLGYTGGNKPPWIRQSGKYTVDQWLSQAHEAGLISTADLSDPSAIQRVMRGKQNTKIPVSPEGVEIPGVAGTAQASSKPQSVSDIMRGMGLTAPTPAPKKTYRRKKPEPTPAPGPATIRSAALDIAGAPETRVRLADLREKIGGTPEQQDAALLDMQKSGEAVLMRNDDPQDITPRDEAAKLMLSGERRDLVYVKPESAPAPTETPKPKTLNDIGTSFKQLVQDFQDGKIPKEEYRKRRLELMKGNSGAALNPAQAVREIAQKAAKKAGEILDGESETKALLRRQAALHKEYAKAQPSERLAIRERILADLDAARERLEVDPEIIAETLREREEKGLFRPVYVDTSPYAGMSRKEVVAEAKRLRVKARGKTQDIAYEVAVEEARRKMAQKLGSSPEQVQDSINRVMAGFDGNAKLKRERGSLANSLRSIDATLIDVRNPSKKKIIETFGKDVGEYITLKLEQAANVPSYAKIMAYDAHNAVYSNLDDTIKTTRAEYYGNPLFEKGEPLTEKQIFNDLLIHRSSAELGKLYPELVFSEGKTQADFQDYINAVKASPNHKKLWDLTERWFDYTRQAPKRLYDAGLIGEEGRAAMEKNQHYVPRKILRPDQNAGLTEWLVSMDGDDTTFQPLTTGSLKPIEEDGALLLEHVLLRTEQRIANNEAAAALIDAYKDIDDPDFFVREGGKGAGKIPVGSSTIKARIAGKEMELVAPQWFVDSWKGKGEFELTETGAKVARWLSGSEILRETATGSLNPIYFLRNMPRDMAHLYGTQDTYSNFLPKAYYDIAKDIWEVGKDAWQGWDRHKVSPLLRDYLAHGGGSATMADYVTRERVIGGKAAKVLNALGAMNQWSENAVRLAHYRRLKREGFTPLQAAAAARDRINFSQGGSLTKTINTFAPYSNVKVQGARATIKALKKDPKRFAWTQSQLIGVAALKASIIYSLGGTITDMAQNELGRVYDMISDEEKAHNHIFPTPFYRTRDGVKQYFYLRIAKEEVEKPATYIGEQLARIRSGRSANFDLLPSLMYQQSGGPTLAQVIPPTAHAALMMVTGQDVFRGNSVNTIGDLPTRVGLDDLSLEDSNANEFFKDVGALTGLSPNRTQAALGKVANGGNPIWGIFSHTYSTIKAAAGGDQAREDELNEKLVDLMLSTSGGAGRFTRSDAAMVSVQVEEKRLSNKNNALLNKKIEEITKGITDMKSADAALREATPWLESLPPNEIEPAFNRLRRAAVMATFPEEVQGVAKSLYWLKEPKIQAINYVDAIISGNEKEREIANEALGASGVYDDPQFQYYFSKLSEKHKDAIEAAKNGTRQKRLNIRAEAEALR